MKSTKMQKKRNLKQEINSGLKSRKVKCPQKSFFFFFTSQKHSESSSFTYKNDINFPLTSRKRAHCYISNTTLG